MYAHIKENFIKETLKEHSDRILQCSKKFLPILKSMIPKVFPDMTQTQKQFIYDAVVDIIVMHDEGKKSPYFQGQKMKNEKFKSFKDKTANHSVLSSIIYLTKYLKKLDELGKEYSKDLEWLIWYFAFLISRHHGNLINFSLQQDGFKDAIRPYLKEKSFFINMDYQYEDICETIGLDSEDGIFIEGQENHLPPKVFVFTRLLYAIMCYSDFVATSIFMSGYEPERESNGSILYEKYNEQEFIKNIRNNVFDCEINKKRNQMFIEAEEEFLKTDSYFYYLSAPCGSGKTNILSNLMFTCMEKEKRENALFVFPLNTLITQTDEIFSKYLIYGQDYMVRNSISEIPFNENESNDFDMMWMNYQFLNYPLLITSHVSLFNILFGCSKNDCMNLLHLINSVIVLDEIQQYKCSLWDKIIEMLNMYSELLDIKFIISSATLPRLGLLLNNKNDGFCELLKTDYSQDAVFKSRVKYNYSLLNSASENLYNAITDIILQNKNQKILIEFITKKDAKEFFGLIKNKFENVELLTGDTNKKEKKRILQKSKTEHMILVATQVIEAGCDVDFEIGIKDTSIVDSEVQFSGRIGRNASFTGIVYFFNKQNPKNVYQKDVRTDLTILNEDVKNMFEDKRFEEFYELIFDKLKFAASRESVAINKLCSYLYFQEIEKQMKLINSDTIEAFVESGEESKKVLEELKNLIYDNSMKYGEKKIKITNKRKECNDFIIQIQHKTLEEYDVIEEKSILGIPIIRERNEDKFL